MGQRDADKVQLDFPQLTADLIRDLHLTGQLGLFELSDVVIPTISVGNVRPQTVSVEPIVFESSEIASGESINAAANTVVADTGALPAGTYDIQAALAATASLSASNDHVVLEHRNAANAATLATLLAINIATAKFAATTFLPLMGYVIALNERLRVISPPALLSGSISASIFAALRATP